MQVWLTATKVAKIQVYLGNHKRFILGRQTCDVNHNTRFLCHDRPIPAEDKNREYHAVAFFLTHKPKSRRVPVRRRTFSLAHTNVCKANRKFSLHFGMKGEDCDEKNPLYHYQCCIGYSSHSDLCKLVVNPRIRKVPTC